MYRAKPVLTDSGRLVPTVIPSHYDVHYSSIDLDRHTFAGVVSIRVDVHPEPAIGDAVVLHAVELDVLSATFQADGDENASGGGSKQQPAAVEAYEFRYSVPSQTCTILFPPSTIEPSTKATLTVTFRGILNDLMHGLYRSTYQSLDGRTLTIATTQFEPTDARRALPCFDEPALKATFRLRVTVDVDPQRPGLRVWSNTPTLSESTALAEGSTGRLRKTYEFAPTPLMSTYLLALIVAELDGISSTPASGPTAGITTTVYTVPGRADQGRFCLEVAGRCLELYATIFGVSYPLTKSDLVAVPDFAAGAMENWGLVTYREAKILVKEGSTSETMKRGIARTVCHELAHQWFGNLVTMESWQQLWLKEGVARFMEFVAIDKIFPEWDAWTEFTQAVYGVGLGLDAMATSHPVEVEVKSSEEIGEIFDAISYAKGASIVRMVSAYMGLDTFLNGMRLYLERHQYGNSTSEMLWQALEEESKLPIKKLALPWTLQTGYPIVQLPDRGGTILTPRYLAGGPSSGDASEEITVRWPIPVTALVEGEDGVQGPWGINGPSRDESEALLMKIFEWSDAGKWFKLNASQAGFFRVAYTKEQWERLSEVMQPSGPLSASDRLGLISDSFAAGRAGYASIVDSLRLVQKFGEHEESEYAVWQELSENLAGLASLYRSTPFFPRFQHYLARIYTKQIVMLGWDAQPGESQRTGTLRGTVINMMGIAGDEAVCAEAFRRFCLYSENPVANPIHGDMMGVIFKTALRHEEDFVYAALKQIYEKSSFPEEQRNCLSAMGRVKDMTRHAEMTHYTLFSGKVRFQDIAFPLNALSTSTDEGGKECWKVLKNKFDSLASKYSSSHVVWGAVVGLSCRGLKTLEEANEVEKFFQQPNHHCGSAKRRLSQALEAVRTMAARLNRDCDAVSKFLECM